MFCFYEFITGFREDSIFRANKNTDLIKISRKDFLKILKQTKDYVRIYICNIFQELFCQEKDQLIFNRFSPFLKCSICSQSTHLTSECLKRQNLLREVQIRKIFFNHKQKRVASHNRRFNEKKKSNRSLQNHIRIADEILKFVDKNSSFCNMLYCEDAHPSSSQLQYSRSHTQSVSGTLSKLSKQQSKNQDQNNSFPVGEMFQDGDFQSIHDDVDPLYGYFRSNQNKRTVRTAGFGEDTAKQRQTIFENIPQAVEEENFQNQQIHRSPEKIKHNRQQQAKLTFMYQQQTSIQSLEEHQIRQSSNRSNTYSNPSMNQKQKNNQLLPLQTVGIIQNRPASPILQSNSQKSDMKFDSDPNFEKSMIRGDSRKKSTRTTNTKVSLLGQLSQFSPLQQADVNKNIINILNQNPIYINVEFGANDFEVCQTFKIYFPYNNVDFVLSRFRQFQNKKKGKIIISSYSEKMYVARKIILVMKILNYQK